MKMDPRLVRGAAILALVSLIAVPAAAIAVPGRGAMKAPKPNANRSQTATTRLAAKRQMLQERIDAVLARRASVFDAAVARISARIEKVAGMASTAASAGGDVTAVLAKLDSARSSIIAAKSAEAEAVAAFKAVPDATDRKASFAAAKAKARSARVSLTDARASLRSAIMALRVVVNGLEPVTP
jgi:hypothetical protein